VEEETMNVKEQRLESIVTKDPKAADTFVRYGLDFCCKGRRTLEQACQEGGLDVSEVVAELAKDGRWSMVDGRDHWAEGIGTDGRWSMVDGGDHGAEGKGREENWAFRPLPELVDHIVRRYHEPLRRALPVLLALARKVESVHEEKRSCPVGLARHIERISEAVEDHLAKEEQILFPIIRAGRGDTAYMPIKVLTDEHVDHGDNLRRTRELTNNLVEPEDACASWRELYRGLRELEADLWRHIHLENYVLFPRALGSSGTGTEAVGEQEEREGGSNRQEGQEHPVTTGRKGV